ncbi:hypothetical protein LOZ66_003382 [Ophidiomyces ophidiicola]|nr:hypothetical protein LOZ66_003382 [Ophidiomyces ophidiicola]
MASNTTAAPGAGRDSNCPTSQPGTATPEPAVTPAHGAQHRVIAAAAAADPAHAPADDASRPSHLPLPVAAAAVDNPAMPSPITTTLIEPVSDASPLPTIPVDNAPGAAAAAAVAPTTEPKPLSPAIGPSSDLPNPSSKESDAAAGSLVITLLLTTGARHPFKIDGKYLRKRSVNVPDHDPFAMSVYTLKELIWREWRSEWEPRPSSPSSIRLISFGKLLDDKAPLSDAKLNRDAPNVVHMTVKPQDVIDEEDAKASKGQYPRGEENERSPGCRCIIL